MRERVCSLKWRESERVVDVLMSACQSSDRWTGSAPGHSHSTAAITQVGGELQMLERRAASKSILIFNEAGRERKGAHPLQRCKFREENVKDRSRAATTYYLHNLLSNSEKLKNHITVFYKTRRRIKFARENQKPTHFRHFCWRK